MDSNLDVNRSHAALDKTRGFTLQNKAMQVYANTDTCLFTFQKSIVFDSTLLQTSDFHNNSSDYNKTHQIDINLLHIYFESLGPLVRCV